MPIAIRTFIIIFALDYKSVLQFFTLGISNFAEKLGWKRHEYWMALGHFERNSYVRRHPLPATCNMYRSELVKKEWSRLIQVNCHMRYDLFALVSMRYFLKRLARLQTHKEKITTTAVKTPRMVIKCILHAPRYLHFFSNLFLSRKKREAVGSMDRSHHVWLRKLELTKNVLWMADWYRPIHFTFFFLILIINQIPPRICRVFFSVHFSEKYCPCTMVDVDVIKYGIDK